MATPSAGVLPNGSNRQPGQREVEHLVIGVVRGLGCPNATQFVRVVQQGVRRSYMVSAGVTVMGSLAFVSSSSFLAIPVRSVCGEWL
jgi:hypothetical protein